MAKLRNAGRLVRSMLCFALLAAGCAKAPEPPPPAPLKITYQGVTFAFPAADVEISDVAPDPFVRLRFETGFDVLLDSRITDERYNNIALIPRKINRIVGVHRLGCLHGPFAYNCFLLARYKSMTFAILFQEQQVIAERDISGKLDRTLFYLKKRDTSDGK